MAESGGLLNRCRALKLYPGFESLPHRQFARLSARSCRSGRIQSHPDSPAAHREWGRIPASKGRRLRRRRISARGGASRRRYPQASLRRPAVVERGGPVSYGAQRRLPGRRPARTVEAAALLPLRRRSRRPYGAKAAAPPLRPQSGRRLPRGLPRGPLARLVPRRYAWLHVSGRPSLTLPSQDLVAGHVDWGGHCTERRRRARLRPAGRAGPLSAPRGRRAGDPGVAHRRPGAGRGVAARPPRPARHCPRRHRRRHPAGVAAAGDPGRARPAPRCRRRRPRPPRIRVRRPPRTRPRPADSRHGRRPCRRARLRHHQRPRQLPGRHAVVGALAAVAPVDDASLAGRGDVRAARAGLDARPAVSVHHPAPDRGRRRGDHAAGAGAGRRDDVDGPVRGPAGGLPRPALRGLGRVPLRRPRRRHHRRHPDHRRDRPGGARSRPAARHAGGDRPRSGRRCSCWSPRSSVNCWPR